MSCPICHKPSDAQAHPFCSRRCADIDLGRWLTGAYVIPDRAIDDEDPPETPPAPPLRPQ